MHPENIEALLFDVFGTCVDWRGTIIDEGAAWNRERRMDVDWSALADAWRGRYQPSMEQVRGGARPFTPLDVLHRESLLELAPQFGLDGLDDVDLYRLNRVWHRLNPWDDTVAGLRRLKKKYIIAPQSNGNVALLVNMAKHAGLPWDLILGAEVVRHYKPQPQAYLEAARLLDLDPGRCLMVAAHNDDLAAARGCGLATAFVRRPREHGPHQTTDLAAADDWHLAVDSFVELAQALGA